MAQNEEDLLELGGRKFASRFILGSGKYSLQLIEAAVRDAGAEIVTVAVRRANTKEHENILDYIPKQVTLLPNTSGARTAEEAVRIAHLARELGCGDFVKIEIMRDSKYLLPDNEATVRATEQLAKEGFIVLPYMYPDLNTARDLVDAGAAGLVLFNSFRAPEIDLDELRLTPRVVATTSEDLGLSLRWVGILRPLLKSTSLAVTGGVHTGTDVLKAIALGASAVLVGRPYIFGLANAGALGVAHVIRLLRDELEIAMALCGCRTLADITPRLIPRPA